MGRWSWSPLSSTSCTLLGSNEEARIGFVEPPLKGGFLKLYLFIMRLVPRWLLFPLEEHLEK